MAINMPKKEPDIFGKIAQGAGTVLGGIIGSVIPGAGTLAGASLGAAIGGGAGGVAAGIANKDVGQAASSAGQGIASAADQGSAMQRRLEADAAKPAPETAPVTMSPETAAIQDGLNALPKLPAEQQHIYGPDLNDAYKKSLRRDFGRIA